jgi:hypothetical protein
MVRVDGYCPTSPVTGHRSGQVITPGQVQPGRSARTARPARIAFSAMRTRRIAIGCRRTGWATTVAMAPSSAPDPLSAEFLAVDLTSQPDAGLAPSPEPGRTPSLEAPPMSWMQASGRLPSDWTRASLPSRTRGAARADAHRVPTPSGPPPGEQDLTLADLTTGRRDLTWNANPGWPGHIDVDWTRIARGHTPRHARRRLRALPYSAFTWTGAGIITAVLLTVLVTTISELIQ